MQGGITSRETLAGKLSDSGRGNSGGRAVIVRLSGNESTAAIARRAVPWTGDRDQGSGSWRCDRGPVVAGTQEPESGGIRRRSKFRGGGGNRGDRDPEPQDPVAGHPIVLLADGLLLVVASGDADDGPSGGAGDDDTRDNHFSADGATAHVGDGRRSSSSGSGRGRATLGHLPEADCVNHLAGDGGWGDGEVLKADRFYSVADFDLETNSLQFDGHTRSAVGQDVVAVDLLEASGQSGGRREAGRFLWLELHRPSRLDLGDEDSLGVGYTHGSSGRADDHLIVAQQRDARAGIRFHHP